MFVSGAFQVADSRSPSWLTIFFFIAGGGLTAQEAAEEAVPDLEVLLDSAVVAAEEGNWELAFALLDQAQALSPGDERIASYREAFLEISSIEKLRLGETGPSRSDEAGGDGNESQTDEPQASEQAEAAPGGQEPSGPEASEESKFFIDRENDGQRNDSSEFRDSLRFDLALKVFGVDPRISQALSTWSQTDEFVYTSFSGSLCYWLPILGKSVGFTLSTDGFARYPGDAQIMLRSYDLGLNIRGFLAEEDDIRLEIGIDFGVALQNEKVSGAVSDSGVFFLGLGITDPLFYHVFGAEALKKLNFGGGMRVYTGFSALQPEAIQYNLDTFWKTGHWKVGVRFDWWNYQLTSGMRESVMAMSFLAGVSF